MEGDVALVEAWRGGDALAGEKLFRRYFKAISRFFRNKFSTGVEDLIQQTFVALVEGRERLRSDQSFRSYLFGIAHNVLRTHLRSLERGRRFDPTSSSIVQLDPGPSTVNAAREARRCHRRLREYLCGSGFQHRHSAYRLPRRRWRSWRARP